MRVTSRCLPVVAVVLFLARMPDAGAATGNTATLYGLSPTDVESAQALSMFTKEGSAAFYNPAYLANQGGTELSLGSLYADWKLKTDGDTLQNGDSDQLLLNLSTDLSGAFRGDHPVGLGLVLATEDSGQRTLDFETRTARDEGQFLQFGAETLFLSVGLGTKVWRGIDIGTSFNFSLNTEADLDFVLENGQGTTSEETIDVNTDLDVSNNFALTVDWGETLCPESGCWMDGLETAFSYREKSQDQTVIEADARDLLPQPLPVFFATVDSFQPTTLALGQTVRLGRWRLALTGEYQKWGDLEGELQRDTVQRVADAEFEDVLVPRGALEYELNDYLSFTGGLAYRESPLESKRNPDMNFLDSDRLIVGFGTSLEFTDPYVLANPVQFDLAYQFHHLQNREFDLTTRQMPNNPSDTVSADGSAHALMGKVRLRF